MEPTASTATAAGAAVACVHFVLLHHGYHGSARDFYYLSGIAEDALKTNPVESPGASPSSSSSPAPHFIFVHPHGSDRMKTEGGVVACARRYIAHVHTIVSQYLSSHRSGACAKDVAAADAPLDIHFSAVGHSMGGLILRYAFPHIMADVRQITAQSGLVCEVHWDTFVTMATPHLGVLYMRSPVMTFLGGVVGHHVSTAIADLFSKNALVTRDLVSDESLAAWGQFKRRVVLNVVNDGTVLVYSSSFVMPLSVRQRIGAGLQPPSSSFTTRGADAGRRSHDEDEFSEATVAEAARGPSHDKELPGSPRAAPHLDVPNADASVVHLAQHGIYCASTIDGLRRNAYELRQLSDELWPVGLLPEQRALADHILRKVGPLELHLADFRPLRDLELQHLPGHVAEARAQMCLSERGMTRLGAHRFSHAAMACKSPFFYPAIFGFVSEYVVSDLLGIPLHLHEASPVAPNAAFSAV